MTSPGPGFTTRVGDLDQIANVWLPQVAQALRVPIATLEEHTPTARPLEVAALYRRVDGQG